MRTVTAQPVRLLTPWNYFCSILAIIFVAEFGVMHLLPLLLPENVDSNFEAFADAAILTLISAPIFWVLLVRPLRSLASEQSLKYAAVVEDARYAILTVDALGRIESINSAGLKLLDACPGQLIRQPLQGLIAEFGLGKDISEGLKIAAARQGVWETVVCDVNGRQVPVEFTVSQLQLPNSIHYTLYIHGIKARKQAELELEEAHRRFVDSAHLAGKAEIATSVLHNVGNVLTSVNVLASTLKEKLADSRVNGLQKAAALLHDHQHDLVNFVTQDSRGQQLPKYLISLAGVLQSEREELLQDINSLNNNLLHANKIVAAQQSFARCRNLDEPTDLAELLENAINVASAALERHSVLVTKEIEYVPPILVDRHKLIQVLVNLLSNAKDAVEFRPAKDRQIHVHLFKDDSDQVRIEIRDNGVGISGEDLTRIFSQGFTTKDTGHGFGLHYSGLAVSEMGGRLFAQSAGEMAGSTLVLELPMRLARQEAF